MHGHMQALADSGDVLHADLSALVSAYGLDPAAVVVTPVRGWRSHVQGRGSQALRRSVYNIARYDLALDRHRGKRAREVPVVVLAGGVLAGCDAPARPALVTVDGHSAPTVTARACAADDCNVPLSYGRRKFCSDRCGARQRQRNCRARLSRTADMSEDRDTQSGGTP